VLVPGDAAATAGNITSSESLYRAAIVSTLVSQMLLFFLGLILFRLFREVDKRLAAVLLASVMMTVGLAIMNTLNHFEALMLLSQAGS
jgi:predicted benzoate:H+ symporter BenE